MEQPTDHSTSLFSLDTGRSQLMRICRRLDVLPARHVIDCAPLLADTIRRLHTEVSLTELSEP